MITSQIQLIADNLHNYQAKISGDDITVEMVEFLDTYGTITIKVHFCGKSWRTSVSFCNSILSLTNPEQKFLEEVLRATIKGNMVDWEQIQEFFS